jgi:hypothetical protein
VAHSSAAFWGAATTRTGTSKAVINRKLFSSLDSPEAVQEDLLTDSAHRQIRVAAMIDELSAASSHRSIEYRAPIQVNGVDPLRLPRQEHPRGTASNFPPADAFTRILDDPLALRDGFLCEHTEPFDARAANAELKTRQLPVETPNVTLGGHIKRVARAGAPLGNWPPPHQAPADSHLRLIVLVNLQCPRVLQRPGLLQFLGSFLRCHEFSPVRVNVPGPNTAGVASQQSAAPYETVAET